MAYLELLPSCSFFQSIEVSFLPISHTHSDIEQIISFLSCLLRMEDAIIMDDLHDALS